MAKFKPFPYGEPLVTPAGNVYRCTGCGGDVRDGMLVYETVRDGKVVGIRALAGLPGPGVPVTHECGEPD
jgi:hypothetical protein